MYLYKLIHIDVLQTHATSRTSQQREKDSCRRLKPLIKKGMSQNVDEVRTHTSTYTHLTLIRRENQQQPSFLLLALRKTTQLLSTALIRD